MNTVRYPLKLLLNPMSVLLVIAMFILSYLYLDLSLAIIFSHWNLRERSPLLNWVTCLGDGVILIWFLMSGLWCRYRSRNILWEQRSWFVAQCIVFSGLICCILKIIFGRARPKMWFNAHEYGLYWFNTKGSYWSFPSGHATTVFSIAFALIFLFPRHRLLFIAIGLLVALSRVLLGYHYLSDVLVGGYLAGLEVVLLIYLLRKKIN